MLAREHAAAWLAAALLLTAAATARADLIAYLKLDGNSTATATNEAGADATLEQFAAADLQQPPSPGAGSAYSVRFDDFGSGPFRRINLGGMAEGAAALTIAMWVNLDADQLGGDKDHTFASMDTYAAGANLIFWRDGADSSNSGGDRSIAALINDRRVVGAGGALNGTGWQHVAMTWEAGATDGFRLYVNGQRTAARTEDIPSDDRIGDAHPGRDLVLGNEQQSGGSGSKDLVGYMDEVGIWTDALPGDSIAGLHDGTYTPGTAPIPEPAALSLLAAGGLALLLRRRRAGL